MRRRCGLRFGAVLGLLVAVPFVLQRGAFAQEHRSATWLSSSAQARLQQLASCATLEAGPWKVHEGYLAHGEDPGLDDSSWPTAQRETATAAPAVWYRLQFRVPAQTHGCSVTGSRIDLNFLAQPVRGGAAEDQGYLGSSKIIYFDGRRVAMGEDLEPVTVFAQAHPGDVVKIAVKVMTDPVEKVQIHPAFRVIPNATRPSPQELHDEILSAAILVPVLASDVKTSEAMIEAALQTVDLAALQAGDSERLDASLVRARTQLEPLAPILAQARIVLAGQSHIDAAYRWPWTETVDIVRRTFGTALQLMGDYPGYTFTQSTAQYSAWLEEKYPAMNAAIRKRIEEGRWEIAGGMWVEPDFNIPDGESQIRQLVMGKRWFQQHQGVDVRVGWTPDSFGYDWQLPQIYKKAGVDYFVTTKLAWSDTNKLPFHLFWWQAPDGSRVLAYFPPTFASGDLNPVRLAEGFANLRKQAPGLNEIMDVYGVGDHGGGATRVMLDEGERWMQPGKLAPKMQFGTALSFFQDVAGRIAEGSPVWDYRTLAAVTTPLSEPAAGKIAIPVWKDELYLEYHRGTYTTHAEQKAHLRRAEEQLLNAEKLASLEWLDGRSYPADTLNEAWKKLLFNGFHDLAPGSAAGPAFKDAARDFEQIRLAVGEVASSSLAALAGSVDTRVERGVPVLVFNPLTWQRAGWVKVDVQLPAAAAGIAVLDARGASLPFVVEAQEERKHLYHLSVQTGPVPALGYTVLHVQPEAQPFARDLHVKGLTLENNALRVTVNAKTGCITSLFDKKAQTETLAAGGCGNQLQAFKDTPRVWDAWNIDAEYADAPIDLGAPVSVELVEQNAARAAIRVIHKTAHSTFTQRIELSAGADTVDVANEIDWHEEHVLLKAAFPLAHSSRTATYEIPYGTIERPTTRENSWERAKFEVPAIRWADLGESGYGFSLINDSKYGYDAQGNVLRLTLLRAPMAPDPTADRGLQRFSYQLYPHAGDWKQALTVRRGYEFNYPLIATQVMPHEGPLPAEHSFVRVDAENVVLTVVKKAEDSNSLILRLYEWAGKSGMVRIHLPQQAQEARVVNLLEKQESAPLSIVAEREIRSEVHPYEIQTLRVTFAAEPPQSARSAR